MGGLLGIGLRRAHRSTLIQDPTSKMPSGIEFLIDFMNVGKFTRLSLRRTHRASEVTHSHLFS